MSGARALRERLPAAVLQEGTLSDGKPCLHVEASALAALAREARELGFAALLCLTGVDRPERGEIEVIYNLYSYARREHLVLKAHCPREAARVPSLSGLWPAAEVLERETYDLVGVVFEGHPRLRRLLLPEGWQGHPLRKDYPMDRPQFVRKGPQGEDVVGFDPQEGW